MSGTVNLQQRLQQLKRVQADLETVLYQAQKQATKKAVQAAADATPPKKGTGRGPYIGTNTMTGELKAHWDSDSRTEPEIHGQQFVTVLANDKEYASYVNDGHRMKRHFVPGLYINPESGLLECDPSAKVGIVVGTKTRYVKGEFMVDKAKKAYQEALLDELDKEIQRRLK